MPNLKSKLSLFLKGFAMGAADVVPGVSGGTVAFITGIYEELIESISNINVGLLKVFKNEGFKAAWQKVNGTFLLILVSGIFTSLLSLAKVVTYLLAEFPIQLWSFFFGLVLASIWLIGKTITHWNVKVVTALIIGTITAYLITIMPPLADSQNLWYIFICGSIAICAMILPGISGSFILVLLGAYTTILGSLSNLLSSVKAKSWDIFMSNGIIVMVFIGGCLVGLISFSRLLNYLFKKSKNIVLAVLTGFLIGSLNKIWPWKVTLESYIKHAGEANEAVIPLIQNNISPAKYEIINNLPAFTGWAILCFCIGILILIMLEKFSKKQ